MQQWIVAMFWHEAVSQQKFLSFPGRDVESIVNVLIEVEDWEGVAGILEINTYSIREECARSLTVFRCQWRNVVQEICYKQAVNNPRQIVCDIANVLENFIRPPRIRQANLLRDVHFGQFGHVFTCMLATGLHTKIKSKLPQLHKKQGVISRASAYKHPSNKEKGCHEQDMAQLGTLWSIIGGTVLLQAVLKV